MSIFQTLVNSGKLFSLRKSLSLTFTGCKCLLVRNNSDVHKKFVSFDDIVAQRRAEARRSLVVQVNSEASFRELYGYCSQYASINGIHHYKNSVGENFMLIEFSSEENLKDIIQSCTAHQRDVDVMASQSPFLWFRASSGKKKNFLVPEEQSLVTKCTGIEVNENDLHERLLKCESVSQQIQTLYDSTALNDLGIRLRYMVARQVESLLESMYANISVQPFGSSVNGFGKLGCDLDLVLTNLVTDDMCLESKRLVFQQKRCEGRAWQRHLELAAEALELRAAGVHRLARILHARVPILKCTHQLAALDCDICCNNMSGVYMSELLWLMGEVDERVRPLVFVVRRWANTMGLTNPHPGRWITNFPLTLMVLFFLQQKSKDGPILPPVKSLVKKAGKEDVRIAEDNINCTFLRDLNKLPLETYAQNQSDLRTLLLQFFEFYSQFDFNDKAISINEGEPIRKPNTLPIYIVNPLEQTLNVSRNVSYEECERLRLEVRDAAWQLESIGDDVTKEMGLLNLIQSKSSRSLNKLLKVGNSHRLVSVKDLFDEEIKTTENKKSDKQIEKNVRELKDYINGNGSKSKKEMKFKNNQVANEVYRIRRNKMT